MGFLAGVLAGNAFPHFVRGITRRRYPSVMGNGPVPNFVAGWASLVVAGLLGYWAGPVQHPALLFGSLSSGVLVIGLFHAGPGAFGRKEPA
ncbi:hypothetical protein FNH05_12895 [Amycolatopsis rhizosphaerae]|uniref:Uncharacterized protein n=1 Tax=Amycolatopsis rhizosphaerae TaxID=2053003 RepID=A0A558CUN1_9PSEU|nr:hypothetical protein [Amycolatopsis rhizosphaerae]TVT52480.1 hypothetical protein FNH05_12895 [Amycolatopsis rhizosphaerae]